MVLGWLRPPVASGILGKEKENIEAGFLFIPSAVNGGRSMNSLILEIVILFFSLLLFEKTLRQKQKRLSYLKCRYSARVLNCHYIERNQSKLMR
jgi:hypothetical protein